SRRTEAWKYSDLKRYLREAPQPSGTAAVGAPGPFYALGGDAIVFANGRAVGVTDFIASGDQTLRLRYITDAVGTGHTAGARVSARAGAQLLLLETHEGAGSAYVAHNRLELDVAHGAEVTRVVLIEEAEDAISIAEAHVKVEAGGVYRQTIVTTGAKLQRIETRITHYAQGAQVQADG
ncbi:MAG: SufD family Fe-S cluster assembly protein, partial [Hyphomonas sp.]